MIHDYDRNFEPDSLKRKPLKQRNPSNAVRFDLSLLDCQKSSLTHQKKMKMLTLRQEQDVR